MFGGGFATIPAYIRDEFGAHCVAPIHGRILLAWSFAAVLGPVLVNYIREYQIYTMNIAPSDAYSTTMYIMASLLIIGLVANLLIRPVKEKHFKELGVENAEANPTYTVDATDIPVRIEPVKLVLLWAVVTIPLIWGLYQVVLKSMALFTR